MRLLFVLTIVAGFGVVGCGDAALPTAPSTTITTPTIQRAVDPETEKLLIDAASSTRVMLWSD